MKDIKTLLMSILYVAVTIGGFALISWLVKLTQKL